MLETRKQAPLLILELPVQAAFLLAIGASTMQAIQRLLLAGIDAAGDSAQHDQPFDLTLQIVRKGELVMMAPWLLHRDPRLFGDPLRFDPDRFLPEREAALPRFAYFPFGGGKRICIGNQFALMEGQIILSTIACHLSMELLSKPPIPLQPFITLRPKGGVNVRIRRSD